MNATLTAQDDIWHPFNSSNSKMLIYSAFMKGRSLFHHAFECGMAQPGLGIV